MDDKNNQNLGNIDEEQRKNQENINKNAEALKTAGKAAATYFGGAAGNKAANTLLSDDNALGRTINKNIVNPVAQDMTKKLNTIPGGQKAVNSLVDSGATDAINKASNISAGNMINSSDFTTEKTANKEENEIFNQDKKIDFSKNKIVIPVLIGAVLLFIFIGLVASLTNTGSDMTAVEMNKYVLSEQENPNYKVNYDDEDYELIYNEQEGQSSGIWGYETNKVFEGQEQFFKRYRAIYNEYRFWHPTLDPNKLTATRLHLLSTLFIDYSPETFNENIEKYSVSKNPSEVDDAYGEGSGYRVCSEDYTSENCTNKVMKKEDYDFSNLDLIKANSEEDYINDQDTVRKLMRNFMVYVGHCSLKKETSCTEGESGCVCNNGKCIKTEKKDIYSQNTMTFWEMIRAFFAGLFGNDPDKKACEEYKKSGWKVKYNYEEQINFCSYYEYLIESDYFETHPHFKPYFDALEKNLLPGQNLEEEKTKLKKIYVRDIIDIAYETDESEPIYTWQQTNDDYTNYTLASSMYITVLPDENGKNGGSYSIDEYVSGVLMDEVGFFYHYRDDYGFSDQQLLEAWKAMAIAIRSYTLSRTKGGTNSIINSSGAQNFTAEYLNSTTKQALLAKQAAAQTQNQVLLLNNYFFSAEYDSFYKKESGGGDSVGGFKCENGFCTVTYLKKGSNSNKVYHEVSVPISWRGKLYGGHGRGMSQWAALYKATLGSSYVDILNFFYASEVTLSNVNFGSGETENVDSGVENTDETGNVNVNLNSIASSGSSHYNGESVQVCKYDIEIPVRLMGVRGMIYDPETGELIPDGETTPVTGDFGQVIKGDDLVVNARQFIGKTREQMATLFDTTGSWCAKFVSYVFSITSGTGVTFSSSLVSSWANYFQSNGSYYHSNYWGKSSNNPNNYNKYPIIANAGGPKVGDIIFFSASACNYDGSGNLPVKSDDCFRHIGIVTGVSGNVVTYTHGNTTNKACGGKNGVCESSISLEDSYIVGFGRWE